VELILILILYDLMIFFIDVNEINVSSTLEEVENQRNSEEYSGPVLDLALILDFSNILTPAQHNINDSKTCAVLLASFLKVFCQLAFPIRLSISQDIYLSINYMPLKKQVKVRGWC